MEAYCRFLSKRIIQCAFRATSFGGVLLPEPLEATEVKQLADSLWNQPGFQSWRALNLTRKQIRQRKLGTFIKGISQILEDLSPAVNVHGVRFVNRLVAPDPTIENISRSNEDSDIEAAKSVEDYNNAFFAQMTRQRVGSSRSPYRRAIDDMTFYGAGFLRYGWRPGIKEKLAGVKMSEWPSPDDDDFEEKMLAIAEKVIGKGFTENPLEVQYVPLATVAFEEDMSVVVEVGERTVGQMLKLYADLDYNEGIGFKDLASGTIDRYSGANWDSTVTYYHVETEEWIYDLIDSTNNEEPHSLEIVPNVAGRPMYALFAGHENGDDDVSDRFYPLVGDIYGVVHTMNVTRTLIQSGALNTGRPMYQEVRDGGHPVQSVMDMTNMPLNQRPVLVFDTSKEMLPKPKAGYHWDVVPAPDMSWVLKAYENSQKDLQDWGFPVSLGPDAPTSGSSESGIQQMKQMEVAINYLDPALTNIAKSLHELFLGVGDALQGMGLPVTISVRKKAEGGERKVRESITLKPDDLREQDLTVDLSSIPASAQLAITEANIRKVEKGLMPISDFLMAEYPDGKAVGERIFLDLGRKKMQEQLMKLLDEFMGAAAGAIFAQVAAEQNVPLPIPPDGGPAPGETTRNARPPVPVPAVGSPITDVDQNPAVSAGTAQIASAP